MAQGAFHIDKHVCQTDQRLKGGQLVGSIGREMLVAVGIELNHIGGIFDCTVNQGFGKKVATACVTLYKAFYSASQPIAGYRGEIGLRRQGSDIAGADLQLLKVLVQRQLTIATGIADQGSSRHVIDADRKVFVKVLCYIAKVEMAGEDCAHTSVGQAVAHLLIVLDNSHQTAYLLNARDVRYQGMVHQGDDPVAGSISRRSLVAHPLKRC